MTATPKDVRHALETYIKAWGTNDKALLMSILAEDAIFCDPVGTPEFKGHEGIGRFWDFSHQGTARELTPVLEEIRACGNEGILRFTMQVRVPAANQGLDLSIVEYVIIDDAGKIKSLRAFWDETSVSKPEGMDLFSPDVSQAYKS
ncbi:MAG: nuclear transport factor 2 [Rhodospirillales bacterium]|nr:nuclear transport factor 2 [Rhodospirillales bacterium]